jgi:sporulation integral membrane protein YlbJ
MHYYGIKLKRMIAPTLFTASCLLLALGIVCHPVAAFHSAQRGLQIWWEIVFPSLLPFFIISELLMKLGFVAFLGTLLEPAMRPLFNLPGTSGFIIAMSYLSGFPLCAILTNRLRQEGMCTRNEGERLLSFTSNASPLFMLGAVSVGMYQNASLGPLIAVIHYLSNFLCGILLKFLFPQKSPPAQSTGRIFYRALSSFAASTQLQTRGSGQIFGETIRNAGLTLLTIGSFITFFSVLTGVLQAAGIFSLLMRILAPVAALLGLDIYLVRGILYGFFEITIGIEEVSHSTSSILTQLLVIEAILAWNGLSIQAQITGILTDSDLRPTPYIITRIIQMPLAMGITYLAFTLPPEELISLPVFSGLQVSSWHPFVWGGIIALTSITLLLCHGLALKIIGILRKRVIIIR